MHHPTLQALAVALLAAAPACAETMYPKNSPVVQIDSKNYDKLIAKSNYTSVSTQPRSGLVWPGLSWSGRIAG